MIVCFRLLLSLLVRVVRKTGAGKYRLLRSLRLPANNRGVRCIAVSQSDIPGALDNLAAETGDGDLLLLDRDSFNLTSAADEAKPLIDTDAGETWLVRHIARQCQWLSGKPSLQP